MNSASAQPQLTFTKRVRVKLARRLGMKDITSPSNAHDNCFTFSAEGGSASLRVKLRQTSSLSLGTDAAEEPMVNVENFEYQLQGRPGVAVRVAPFKGVWAMLLCDGGAFSVVPGTLDPVLKRRMTLVARAVRNSVALPNRNI